MRTPPVSRVVAVIPARGGSRRLPGKNLALLGGRPLIAHTIEAARGAYLVDQVIVSTEDATIARVARAHGAQVLRRPARLATDHATTEAVLLHAVDQLRRRGARPDVVVLLQATSPLRTAAPVDMAVARILDGGCDSVISVTSDPHLHWEGALEEGIFVPRRPLADRPRTQDLPPRYREDGAIYAMRTRLLLSTGLRMGGKLGAVLLSPEESVDIDTAADLALAAHHLERRAHDPDVGAGRPRPSAIAV
jgi:CMP-N,N'-diacetyllegionaminic acid synthase